MPRPTSPGGPSLRTLLRAGEVLLRPPQPLPSNPPDILQRLKACSKVLPKEWKRSCPEWSDDDELDQVGNSAPALPSAVIVNPNTGVMVMEEEQRRKKRKEELLFIVGKRCFALIKAIQNWLKREFWPKDERGGMEQKDFLLGTADLRLIKLMVSHVTFSYLLSLTIEYARSLPHIDPSTADPLSSGIETLLGILRSPSPPRPAAGPSSQSPIPPTIVTENIISSHLMPVFLATVILAYTPSSPPEKNAHLRKAFNGVLMDMTPGYAISTLVNVLKLLIQGRNPGVKPNGWVREWPKYPDSIVNGILTFQTRRPGGVRGLMENVLGESAKTDNFASVDGKKLDHIFNLLVRIPRESTEETYYPWLLSELFAMIPLTASSPHHPVAFVNTACYIIQRLSATDRPLIKEWLKTKLHSPWYPKLTVLPKQGEPVVAASWEAIKRSIQNINLLLLENPKIPEFIEFIVTGILPPLFSLFTFLSHDRNDGGEPQIPRVDKRDGHRAKVTIFSELLADVRYSLISWGKNSSKEACVKGIWSIVEGGNGWGRDQADGTFPALFWEKEERDGGVRLMAGSPSDSDLILNSALPDIVLPHSAVPTSAQPDDRARNLLAEPRASPDAKVLCGVIQAFARPDVSSEVILKSLDLWRVRTSTEVEPSMDSLLNLQLTITMMEQLGDQLFAKPNQVLGFVERVLSDQVVALDNAEMSAPLKLNSRLIEVDGEGHGGLDDDLAPDGKRGLIEVACQLLASLEAEGQLSEDDLTILQPIAFHLTEISARSPSVSIRNASREAYLLLQAHQEPNRGAAEHFEDPKQIAAEAYKQALGSINDTELPVRAHGLIRLRDLVISESFDRTLITSILDVFMKNIEDDDSFIYLSAVKGLSGTVDVIGREVFEKVIAIYEADVDSLKGDSEGIMLDKILRLAEVLDQVIKRAGETLGEYANQIIPTLMRVFPDSSLPTIVRSSALSLLTSCAATSYLAILPWTSELAEATIDLVQLESVTSSPFRPPSSTPEIQIGLKEVESRWKNGPRKIQLIEDEEPEEEEQEVKVVQPRIVDSDPIKKADSKHPTLRRAALVLLEEVFRTLYAIGIRKIMKGQQFISASDIKIRPIVEPIILERPRKESKVLESIAGEEEWQVSPSLIDRAETVLQYVAQTDEDEIVRGHAEAIVGELDMVRLVARGKAASESGLSSGLEKLRLN
ncbi:hypothetical protein IAR55_001410 [Kwoniella newhampshirensis]|uniref:RNA polymerase II assembly factor Rtp1 C-terminal domain-containing protein n=1 Tax=Kwoniella newhampshirensis TaxID=1651941 RepID=A0AAW0Z295_9TREE